FEKRRPTKCCLKDGYQSGTEPRHHHENTPKTKNDTRDSREHLHQGSDGSTDPLRCHLRKVNSSGDTQRDRNNQSEDRRYERAEDKGQRTVFIVYRVPRRTRKK